MSPRALTTTAGVLCAGLLAGCGISDPYQHPSATTSTARTSSSSPSTSTTTQAADAQDPAPERGGTIPAAARRAQQHVEAGAGSPTARQAVLRYAQLYINWTGQTLAPHQRQLARLAIGPARQNAELQGQGAPTDRTIRTAHLANHGQVVSAQPGSGAEHGRWVIVTREQTTGRGSYHALPAQLHITLATTTHTPHGWVITQWSPQN